MPRQSLRPRARLHRQSPNGFQVGGDLEFHLETCGQVRGGPEQILMVPVYQVERQLWNQK